ncbi:MAG: TIGR04255 family protein [Solirubrobacteraceae bacterium]
MNAFPPAEQPVSFRDPPVMEVAFALQFASGVIDLELLGEIARRAKTTFPRREQQPPLPPMTEEFGLPPAMPQFIFQTGQALPRTWFISEDGAVLIQVQADRLGYNWRREHLDERPYPRYGCLRDDVIKLVLPAADDVATSSPAARINMVELTYVNQLRAQDARKGDPHPPLPDFLRPIGHFQGEFLSEPEDARLQARWRIPGDGGDPIGRLYAAAEPAFLHDQTPIYQLVLTARLIAGHAVPADTIPLFDVAHNWIVRGFKDLTTDTMQSVWGPVEGETE